MLHRFVESGQVDDIQELFKLSIVDPADVSTIRNHVPIIKNFDQKTALHIAFKEKQDFKSVDIMIKYLSGYGVDHHSRAIVEILPEFIEKEIPSIFKYITSRFQQNDEVKHIEKGALKDGKNLVPAMLWFDKKEFKAEVMDPEKKIESNI